MATKLPKYTLDYDKKKEAWELTNDKTDEVLRRFDRKTDATKAACSKRRSARPAAP